METKADSQNVLPKVSICIPTFNRSDLLRMTLNSVIKQTVKPFEVIVVDNCSLDDTEAVARSFEDKGVRYFRNESNIGFVGNWNRCIELARGDFLTILHSDDMISPRWMEEWSNIISKYRDDVSVGAFFSHVFTVDIKGETLIVFKLFSEERLLRPGDNLRELWKRNMYGLPASGGLLLRRSVFEKIGRYEERYGTETDAALVMKLLNEYSVVFTPKYLYAYRIHGFQTFDKEKAVKTFEKKYAVLERYLGILKVFYENGLRPIFRTPEFYKRVALMYISIGILHFFTFRPSVARPYFRLTKQKIPDLFDRPGDYYLLLTILIHYIKAIIYGKLRVFLGFSGIAKSWGSA